MAAALSGCTTSVALPCFPPTDAVITVCPAATAATAPPELIVAMDGDAEDHDTLLSASGFAFWSAPAAVAVAVCPTWMVDGARVTLTDASLGSGGVVVTSDALPQDDRVKAAHKQQTTPDAVRCIEGPELDDRCSRTTIMPDVVAMVKAPP